MPSLTNDSRQFLSTSVRLGGVIDFFLTLGLLGTWIGCLGRFHWFLALFDHFRVQGSIACFFALVILLFRRSWRLAGFALVSLSVNLWPLIKTNSPLPAGVVADDGPSLKIVCFNALFSNEQLTDIQNYLVKQDADVIVLLEFSPDLEAALHSTARSHPHGIRRPDPSPWGIGVYSRIPVREVSSHTFADEEPPSIDGLLDFHGRSVRLIATHPWPPTGTRSSRYMTHQLSAIADFVNLHSDTPAIVMGDFNATPWSPSMAILLGRSELDFRTPKAVWRPTWQVGSLLSLPIDHALCTPPLFFEKREIGPDLGSDHRPQELTVRWSKDTTS